jgi:hypothetical protein
VAVLTEDRPRTLAELDALRPLVEHLTGRPLRKYERAMDVLGIDDVLNDAKEDLDLAIKAEQKREIRSALKDHRRIRLELTSRMLYPLERLFRLGRREAYAELERLGYENMTSAYVAQPEPPELDQQADVIRLVARPAEREDRKPPC